MKSSPDTSTETRVEKLRSYLRSQVQKTVRNWGRITLVITLLMVPSFYVLAGTWYQSADYAGTTQAAFLWGIRVLGLFGLVAAPIFIVTVRRYRTRWTFWATTCGLWFAISGPEWHAGSNLLRVVGLMFAMGAVFAHQGVYDDRNLASDDNGKNAAKSSPRNR